MNKLLYAMALGFGLNCAHAAPAIELENAWVRALPPTQKLTAAYLFVINRGASELLITGASSALAGRVEIHRSREIDGYVRMEQVQQLKLAPGESLDLSPGGTHLMLLDLQRMPAPGERAQICLVVEPGGEQCVEAQVRKSAQTGAMGHHDHH